MKIAYLTLDDAPSPDLKNKIRYLGSKNIPAIIFCRGQQIAPYKHDLIEAIQQGFIVGNHSYTHAKFSELSFAQMENEIATTDSIIDDLYAHAGIKRPKKFFRFPYGDRGGDQAQAAQLLLEKYGYEAGTFAGITYPFYIQHAQESPRDVWWTFNVLEYQFKSASDLSKRLESQDWPLGVDIPQPGGFLSSGSAEIVIIHDHAETSGLFQQIIDGLLERGIVFEACI